MPLQPDVITALDRLPIPRGSVADSDYYFWTGNGTVIDAANTAGRSLKAVFERSGGLDAHAHRFRHTLATDILANSVTAEHAANILGNDPATIRLHYATWTPELRNRTV